MGGFYVPPIFLTSFFTDFTEELLQGSSVSQCRPWKSLSLRQQGCNWNPLIGDPGKR